MVSQAEATIHLRHHMDGAQEMMANANLIITVEDTAIVQLPRDQGWTGRRLVALDQIYCYYLDLLRSLALAVCGFWAARNKQFCDAGYSL
jgi:hypothetical protein